MYHYHGTVEHKRRLGLDICRCASKSAGLVYDLASLLGKGVILHPVTKAPLTTPDVAKAKSDPPPIGGGIGLTFIFAVSESYSVHIALDGDRGQADSVKHETLFHNAPVLAAGEICIKQGIVSKINDLSGSYGTMGKMEADPAFAEAVLEAFKKHNCPVEAALIDELQNLRVP